MRNTILIDSSLDLHHSQSHEYLLIAQPSEAVVKQLIREMQFFCGKYYSATQAFVQPHIVVTAFHAKEEAEDTCIRWMHRIISAQNSFEVVLSNFSGVAPHSIHVRVQNPQPFTHLANELQIVNQFIRSYDSSPAMSEVQPYIPIAGKLPQHIYDHAIFDYSRRDFHSSFNLTELRLLKRGDEFEQYKQVSVFRMQPSKEYAIGVV